jgi:hypothetical protein
MDSKRRALSVEKIRKKISNVLLTGSTISGCSVLLITKILYGVQDFLSHSPTLCSVRASRGCDQLLQRSGPGCQDRRDRLAAPYGHLIAMRFGDLLD